MSDAGRRRTRVPQAWFEELYAADLDPWNFRHSEYERRKYDLSAASLPRSHYRSAFEPGCSIGELTRRLASRCDSLLATDIVPTIVAVAADAAREWPGVTVERRTIPDEWPDGSFDLVVLSEVGYYLSAGELDEVIRRAVASLEPSGHLLAVHWLGQTDYPLTGAEVHARIDAAGALGRVVLHQEPEWELRCWQRR